MAFQTVSLETIVARCRDQGDKRNPVDMGVQTTHLAVGGEKQTSTHIYGKIQIIWKETNSATIDIICAPSAGPDRLLYVLSVALAARSGEGVRSGH